MSLALAWSEKVQQHLEEQGIAAWRDERAIEEGDDNWCQRLEQGLARADVVICIVGRDTDACHWQEKEMLRAVELQQSVVVLRLDNTCLPLYVQEKQPVEARPDQQATLQLLTEEVTAAGRASLARGPDQGNAVDPAINPPFAESLQRQYERAYLNDLIHVHYSDREARYIPVAAHERRDPSWERDMQTVMKTTAILRAFNRDAPAGEQAEEKSYDDALVAYRDLQHKPVRRLALLGEPGAGKSFSLR